MVYMQQINLAPHLDKKLFLIKLIKLNHMLMLISKLGATIFFFRNERKIVLSDSQIYMYVNKKFLNEKFLKLITKI